MNLLFKQFFDQRIDLETADGKPVASYRFDPDLPKPCFWPLYTPAGRQFAGFQMSDHQWHRGLWFTIKYINGANFWEERPPFGIQRTLSQPHCKFVSHESIQINHSLRWTSQATGDVFEESREIVFALRPDGFRSIDWSTTLTALDDLLLDRTPYTTWGGYSGLTFRASREFHGSSYLLPDGQTSQALLGTSHPWALLRGIVDGAPDARIAVGLIDHPKNPRSPMPFYAKAGQSYDFMNAAFLFHEPMKVSRDQKLAFRHRLLYRDGWWEAADFNELATEFVRAAP
jgi:hypothetical protein